MNDEQPQGPLGDVIPRKDARTGGGQPQQKVEDRPNVSQVSPEDYPEDQRASGRDVTNERGDASPTETQPNPNVSTEHQKEGDARRPRDVLDRDDVKRDPDSGNTIPDDYDPASGDPRR